MLRKTTSLEAVATIGIDIGKNTFHLVSLPKIISGHIGDATLPEQE